ncbi:hypothetical protein [Legionella longbeachae]|uniref:Putative coiled-coil protein n=1 Tax=Legionella longbeachae serogroup 1 (strain NSW150) TaxID=661367 RepID=D3HNY2_LEGLN|nr:hypothetical protein [Legionella longbeachae]ARB92501.1 hypothetical protein A6J40_10105 [Legionella longbeachae]CBJ10595.1 putative coiled-coil protein [Legionella longbeachae NSW150]VEE01122.1 coiled-coil protein [Legionella oakridgensis]
MDITISISSQKWIKKYLLASGVRRNESLPSTSIQFKTLIAWLSTDPIRSFGKSKNRQKIEIILVSLQTALLRDLSLSMQGEYEKVERKGNNDSSRMSKIKFFFLTSAGILVTACQGFDGVVTMLSVFAMSPSILLGIGFAFILLSVIVFFGVDLVKVSNALGVKLSEYKLLDAYLLQLQRIKAIRKKINDYTLVAMSQEDLQQLELVLSMLHKRLKFLAVASKQFEEALNNKNVQMIKTVISGVSALFFFGGGFFAGQSVALFISSLVLDSALPTFWPVIVFSALVGLAALSIYWYVERPELEKLVTNWFGLNEEKVQQLCDKSSVDKEANKLTSVKEKVISTARLIKRLAQLEHGNSRDEQTLASNTTQNKAVADLRVSSNFYSFLKLSVSAIPRENQDLHEIMFCGVK